MQPFAEKFFGPLGHPFGSCDDGPVAVRLTPSSRKPGFSRKRLSEVLAERAVELSGETRGEAALGWLSAAEREQVGAGGDCRRFQICHLGDLEHQRGQGVVCRAVDLDERPRRAFDSVHRAEVGDARSLPYDDASFDVVVLFGPLYRALWMISFPITGSHLRRSLRRSLFVKRHDVQDLHVVPVADQPGGVHTVGSADVEDPLRRLESLAEKGLSTE
jgi:hypothetical protein